MKKLLNVFFVTLGVIFSIIILFGLYLYITDPLNLKPLIFDTESNTVPAGEQTDTHPLLSASQEKALETFGIDPATVPSEITPEQEACFIDALGADRVAEIKAGDSPTATEYFKAKDCI